MELSAIEDMERAANNNLTLFLNHSYNVPEDVGGSITRASIAARDSDQDGRPNYDLDIEGVINEANPRAVQTFNALESGTKLGISIGAMIPEGGAELNRKTGTYTIRHVDLLEASFVGIPANPRSWVEYAVKSLRGKAAVETEEEEAPILEEAEEAAETPVDPEEADEAEEGAPSQDASESKPENEGGLLDETADGDDERLGDTVTYAASTSDTVSWSPTITTNGTSPVVYTQFPEIASLTDSLRKTVEELVDAKKALGERDMQIKALERERDEALAQRDRVLEVTTQTLERVARIPLARKTHFAEAESDFRRRMSSVYPEGFLKMMEDRT
jgi:phage head maturation protease